MGVGGTFVGRYGTNAPIKRLNAAVTPTHPAQSILRVHVAQTTSRPAVPGRAI